jgi:hypothetical protein
MWQDGAMGWGDAIRRLLIICSAELALQSCAAVGFSNDHESESTSNNAPSAHCFLWLGQAQAEFDLNNREDLHRLERKVSSELALFRNFPHKKGLEKREQRGLKEIQRLTEALLSCTETQRACRLKTSLAETAAAEDNARRPPLPQTVDFFQTPLVFLNRLSRPVGKGQTRAANLQPGKHPYPSLWDPQPSTFWRRPRSISDQDLYHGFGRAHLLLESDPLCAYTGPKESFGRNPGFNVEAQGVKLKVKFAEISSEPFATRTFDALGYHTDPTDYSAGIRIRYSRLIFLEFNSRKPLQTQFTFLALVPLFKLELQHEYDPFDYISAAVLTDGTRWSGTELKRHLLRHPRLLGAATDPANYLPGVESAIAYLETVPASVQEKRGKSIGPWDFGELDHASRRELRGAGLLAAWLGWFDTRADNTRLRIVEHQGSLELEHYFSDLGGVLGETTGILYARGELPNAFPWTFTRPPLWQGEHRLARPLRLAGYKPIVRTLAFAEMTLEDARWMARLIGALREDQIQEALIASGFDSAQARLYLAKLLSRRAQMMVDLGMAHEPRFAKGIAENRRFSYDPATEGTLRVQIAGNVVEAPVGVYRVVDGRLSPAISQKKDGSRARASVPKGFSF